MPQRTQQVEQILEQLVRDVEASVHAFYRGDVRQHTARVKTGTFLATAREALTPFVMDQPLTSASSPGAAPSLAPDELAAITRCVMAWLPMGVPAQASPQSRCVAAAREMAPTWGEREKARLAMRRATG
jgi:hypothetical protein